MNWGFNPFPCLRATLLMVVLAIYFLSFAPPARGSDSGFPHRFWKAAHWDGFPVAAFSSQAKPAKMDRWTSPDKFDHLLVSAVLSGGAFLSLTVTRNDADRSFVSSVGAVIALGAFKEMYDAYHPRHQSSWKDFTADVIGACLGALITRSL